MSAAGPPDTIVLIHGFWVTPRSWEDWMPSKDGWQEVADYALDWAVRHARRPARA